MFDEGSEAPKTDTAALLDRQALEIDFLEGKVSIGLIATAPDANWLGLTLRSGEHTVNLLVDASLLPKMLSASGYTDTPEMWMAETRLLVMMHLLQPLIAALEAVFDGPVSARIDPDTLENSEDALCFSTTSSHLGDGFFKIVVEGEPREKIIDLLTSQMPQADDAEKTEERTTLRLLSPTFEMPMEEFEVLVEGDVLDLDPDCDLFGKARVVLGGTQAAKTSRTEDGYAIASELEPIAPDKASDTAEQTDPLAGKTLPLTFELGRGRYRH